jgi:hypothetical protein
MAKRNLAQLTGLVKTRLRRMQYRPGLLNGFLASTGLGLAPFSNPNIDDASFSMAEVTERDGLIIRRWLGAQPCACPASRHWSPDALGDAMPKQATDTGIPVGLTEHQALTGPAVPLTFERPPVLGAPGR